MQSARELIPLLLSRKSIECDTVAVVESLIPSSVCREKRDIVMQGSVPWIPLYCANCGKADGGMVTQETLDALGNYAFYLCDPCSEKCGDIPGHHKIPMEVYWQKVAEAILE